MHFSVLVVGSVEDQMAPYQENNMDNCPKEFLEEELFFTTKEAREKYKEALKSEEGKKYKSLENYMNQEYGYRKISRGYGYLSNPNSHWDWYVIGGRWRGYLLKKSQVLEDKIIRGELDSFGSKGYFTDGIDGAYKKDIDWEEMKKRKKGDALVQWNDYTAEKNKIERVVDDETLRSKFGIPSGKITKQEFLNLRTAFKTCAFVDSEGSWHDDLTQKTFDELLQLVKEDEFITIVDCHC